MKTTHFARAIRNPQLSRKIGNLYFLHGRTRQSEPRPSASGALLFSGWDTLGRRQDSGIAGAPVRGDAYSANEVIGKYDPSIPNRLLIQSSISYEADSLKVNERHWWVEDIDGA